MTLINEADRQGSTSNSPRVDNGTVTVEIRENDNSRGLLQFVRSELTVDEDVGSIVLVVERGRGVFGNVGTDFNVTGITADLEDFSPQSGTVDYEVAMTSQNITIYIINDSEAELEEVSKKITIPYTDGQSLLYYFLCPVFCGISGEPSRWCCDW